VATAPDGPTKRVSQTLEADNESIDRGAIFEALSEHIDEHTLILRGLPWADQAMEADFSGMTPMDEMELLVGVRFADSAARWSDVCASLQRAGHDLCELGARQLGYLGEYHTTDPIWSRNYFELALRVGRSAYPLLAHRAAFLTGDLLERATTAEVETTVQTLRGFFER
jgi:hypothetical protein